MALHASMQMLQSVDIKACSRMVPSLSIMQKSLLGDSSPLNHDCFQCLVAYQLLYIIGYNRKDTVTWLSILYLCLFHIP